MKLSRQKVFLVTAAFLVLGGAASFRSLAATASNAPAATKGKAKASTAAPSATNAAPAQMPIPKSRFAGATDPGRGIDPFFPKSTRFDARTTPVATQTNKAVVVVEPEVKINGFSGGPELPLVIINNVTFGVGDNQLVRADNLPGDVRLRVRCLEIRMQDQVAIVEVNGARRELRFANKK